MSMQALTACAACGQPHSTAATGPPRMLTTLQLRIADSCRQKQAACSTSKQSGEGYGGRLRLPVMCLDHADQQQQCQPGLSRWNAD